MIALRARLQVPRGGMGYNLTSASPLALKCLLLGVPIEPADAGLLRVHFQPKSEHREDTVNEFSTATC